MPHAASGRLQHGHERRGRYRAVVSMPHAASGRLQLSSSRMIQASFSSFNAARGKWSVATVGKIRDGHCKAVSMPHAASGQLQQNVKCPKER